MHLGDKRTSEFELQGAGDEVVNDAIGELTNMVVGGFKNALCDAGYPCRLTIPSISAGRNFLHRADELAVQRHVYMSSAAATGLPFDIIQSDDQGRPFPAHAAENPHGGRPEAFVPHHQSLAKAFKTYDRDIFEAGNGRGPGRTGMSNSSSSTSPCR